ncbi:hypothetical protein CleRT_00730 [Candidatus Coxiella mudrowiae]|uniref:Uncharacterized protein n=2 Tax=Candidatus Coxiella mudrowiae TaxID=2054173 RepID=A0ABN4HPQ1_9COXI|nr:hypothetical protein CleRT_00730 [Candidatus Coxiella mudrowiae]
MLIEFRQQAEKLWQILRADSLERAVTGLVIFNSYAQGLSPQPQALIEENPNRYIIQCLDFLKYYLLPFAYYNSNYFKGIFCSRYGFTPDAWLRQGIYPRNGNVEADTKEKENTFLLKMYN